MVSSNVHVCLMRSMFVYGRIDVEVSLEPYVACAQREIVSSESRL
jgi:hypothetical protein